MESGWNMFEKLNLEFFFEMNAGMHKICTKIPNNFKFWLGKKALTFILYAVLSYNEDVQVSISLQRSMPVSIKLDL